MTPGRPCSPRPSLEMRASTPIAQPAREHERAAVAEERQRNPGDRHEVERHADVLEDVREPAREQPERHQAAERIVRALRDADHAQEQKQEQRERDQYADEAELLADDREDEVRVLLGKKREPLLRAVQIAAPEPTARPDRDDRLDHVVAAAARIDRRIEEHLEAILPVRRHVLPDQRPDDAHHDVGRDDEQRLRQRYGLYQSTSASSEQEPRAPDARVEPEHQADHRAREEHEQLPRARRPRTASRRRSRRTRSTCRGRPARRSAATARRRRRSASTARSSIWARRDSDASTRASISTTVSFANSAGWPRRWPAIVSQPDVLVAVPAPEPRPTSRADEQEQRERRRPAPSSTRSGAPTRGSRRTRATKPTTTQTSCRVPGAGRVCRHVGLASGEDDRRCRYTVSASAATISGRSTLMRRRCRHQPVFTIGVVDLRVEIVLHDLGREASPTSRLRTSTFGTITTTTIFGSSAGAKPANHA